MQLNGIIHSARRIIAPIIRLPTAVVLLHAFAASMTVAQEGPLDGISVGIGAGKEIGMISARFPIRAGSPGCGEFIPDGSSGTWYGARLDLPEFFSPYLGVSLRPGTLQTEERFVGDVSDPLWVFDPTSLSEVRIAREFGYRAISRSFSLDILARYRIAGGWSVAAGPRFGYRYSVERSQTDRMLDAGTIGFAQGSDVRQMEEGESFTSQPMMIEAVAAGSYELPIGAHLSLIAELSGAAPLLSSVREADWRNFSLRGTIGVLIVPGLRDDYDTAAVTPPDTAPPPPSSPVSAIEDARPDSAGHAPPADSTMTPAGPDASIRIYGIDERGEKRPSAVVRVIETLHRRQIVLDWALPPTDDASPAAARFVLRSQRDAEGFTADSLAELDAKALQGHLLNIAGERLRSTPDARLILGMTASNAAGERQAEAARQYLADIWAIDSSRIIVRPAENGSDAGGSPERTPSPGRIQISSDVPAITAPLVFDHVERNFISPLLKLEPSYTSDTGISTWDIALDLRGTTIARYSSGVASDTNEISYDWKRVYDQLASDSSFLTATFTVEDLAGRRMTARSRIPVHAEIRRRMIERRSETETGREQIIYVFSPADSSSPELQQPESGVIAAIARSAGDGAGVEIIGITGDDGLTAPGAVVSERTAELLRIIRTAIAHGSTGRSGAHATRLLPRADAALAFPDLPLQPGSIMVHIQNHR